MSDDTASTQLLHQHHTVLILRLTLDQQRQLYQGILLDLDRQTIGKFHDWQELVALLQQWQTTRPSP